MVEEQKPELPKLRTLKNDADVFVKENKISEFDIKKAAYIEQSEIRNFRSFPKIPIKKIIYTAVAVLVISGGGYFIYKFFTKPSTQVIEEPKPPTQIVNADGEKIIQFQSSKPGDMISALQKESGNNLVGNSIIYFPLEMVNESGTKKFISSIDFAQLVSWNAPQDFLDNLTDDFNMLMVYNGTSSSAAVIMKINNFENGIVSLLNWEQTMWASWKPFLSPDDIQKIQNFYFYDDVIQNNDARVLKSNATGDKGRIIFGYSIFNKQYVVFATSREALSTILSRLIALPPR